MAKRIFKTKRVLSGRAEFRKWADWDEGDIIIARLEGTTPNKKSRQKNDWIVFVEEAHFSDKKEAKRLQGKRVQLNAAGQLDKGMSQVEVGDTVQITYNGQQEIQGGEYKGEMAHLMEVVEVEEDTGEEDTDDSEEQEDEDDGDDL